MFFRRRSWIRTFPSFMVALLVLPTALIGAPAYASDADEIPFNTAKILEYHNAERATRQVAALSRDPRMDSHAQALAENLAARGVLQHTPAVALTLGYSAGGQNLVFRSPSINASEANFMWMNSPNHRKNLLNPGFSHVGIGIACSRASGKPFPVAVVDFGGSSLSSAVPPQEPISVPPGALQGHSVACDNSGGPGAAAPQPPPAAPVAPPPAPVAAPVAPKPEAPNPAAPPVESRPAPAPPVPIAAPVEEPAPAPAPAAVETDSTPAEGPHPPGLVAPADDSFKTASDQALAGWGALVAGAIGAVMLSLVGAGLRYKLRFPNTGGPRKKYSLIDVLRSADR